MSANPLPLVKILESTGYGTSLQNNPSRVLDSQGFQKLLAEKIPEDFVAEKHLELLKATKLDHMIFPLGPEGEDDINLSGGVNPPKEKEKSRETDELEDQPNGGALLRRGGAEETERTTLTDKEIIAMLAEVNCVVRRIVHGETARHVYFWAADNMARDKAVDKAYKLRGRYQNENEQLKTNPGNTYNFFFKPSIQAKVKVMEDELKAALIQKHVEPLP